MNTQQARKLWLKQLRSPDAEYFDGGLASSTNRNARCCLGHACHALGVEVTCELDTLLSYGNEEAYLPDDTAWMLDITHEGRFREDMKVNGIVCDSLAEVNDRCALLPAKMADFIEANWDNLEEYK